MTLAAGAGQLGREMKLYQSTCVSKGETVSGRVLLDDL